MSYSLVATEKNHVVFGGRFGDEGGSGWRHGGPSVMQTVERGGRRSWSRAAYVVVGLMASLRPPGKLNCVDGV